MYVPHKSIDVAADNPAADIPLDIYVPPTLPLSPQGFRASLVLVVDNQGTVDVTPVIDGDNNAASAEVIPAGGQARFGPMGYNGGDAPMKLLAAAASTCRVTPKVRLSAGENW